MKTTILPYQNKEHTFYISPFNGKLYKIGNNIFRKKCLAEKLKTAINAVDNPFSFEALNPEDSSSQYDEINFKKASQFHNSLLKLGNKHFFLSRKYAVCTRVLFNNSVEAFDTISIMDKQIDFKNELCLQRSLLVMKTSKSFKNNGVLFIGASFPSGKMHAWIIENGIQPDRLDRNWIMYRPLLALYY